MKKLFLLLFPILFLIPSGAFAAAPLTEQCLNNYTKALHNLKYNPNSYAIVKPDMSGGSFNMRFDDPSINFDKIGCSNQPFESWTPEESADYIIGQANRLITPEAKVAYAEADAKFLELMNTNKRRIWAARDREEKYSKRFEDILENIKSWKPRKATSDSTILCGHKPYPNECKSYKKGQVIVSKKLSRKMTKKLMASLRKVKSALIREKKVVHKLFTNLNAYEGFYAQKVMPVVAPGKPTTRFAYLKEFVDFQIIIGRDMLNVSLGKQKKLQVFPYLTTTENFESWSALSLRFASPPTPMVVCEGDKCSLQ